MSSIFVQIAAYRDLELELTINDAIKRASGKNNLVLGVHNCRRHFDDPVNLPTDLPDWVEIRFIESIAPVNIGVCNARYVANELYKDEDYYFQIDSHMRFITNWDTVLIEDYLWHQSIGIELPLMSMYPPNYWYVDDDLNEEYDVLDHRRQTKIIFNEQFHDFKKTLVANQTAVAISEMCIYTPSVSAAVIFTHGSFGKIKPNRKIAFWGEELLTAARAFTHGFTPVVLRRTVAWHLYVNGRPKRLVRREHSWHDWNDIWEELNTASLKEVKDIFKTNRISEDGFGSVRTLKDFEEFAGLDFTNGIILENEATKKPT